MSSSDQLCLQLGACSKAWLFVYLAASVAFGIFSPMVHVAAIGLLLCLSAYFRLPLPDTGNEFKILGHDPRNLDGTPSRARGALGLIAHRAAGLDAPENSLEALRLAKKNGAKCVEFDVLLTADGYPVIFHDEDSVERLTDGTGRIGDMTLEEVRCLDLAAKHALKDQYTPTRIPTMDDFIDECLKLDMKMIIDLKRMRSIEHTVDLVVATYKKKPKLYEMALASSFSPLLLYSIRRKDPSICCSMAWRQGYYAFKNYSPVEKECVRRFSSPLEHHLAVAQDFFHKWAYHELYWYVVGLSAVLIHKDALTPAAVQRWRERGLRVMAWTINNSLERVYLEKVLHVTTMSDTMDEVSVDEVLKNW